MSSQLMGFVARRSSFLLSGLRQNVRLLSTPVEAPKAAPTPAPDARYKSATHKVDGLERRMLVWTGKFKSADDVPTFINQEIMESARNKMRIRLANIMMAVTALACLFMIYSGKQAAERGDTVQKMNLDWHKEYNEQSRAEAEAARSKSK